MFEFSIVFQNEYLSAAKSLYEELKATASNFGAIVTSYSEKDQIFVVVACDQIEKSRISFFIADAVSDFISYEYKLKFIKENLKIPIKNTLNLNALIKAMVAFDRETDKYIVSRNLILKDNLIIESFYHFKLKKLRNKWMELIKLTNENSGYLLCNDTFIDLLKFLIENIETSKEMVNVIYDGRNYKICDENFQEIQNKQTENTEDAFLITSLIELSPKRINLYCDDYIESDVITLISQIFERRVNILPLCSI